jgi:SpoVK/Ycf46/Vps4 family AAA+-type ATPase
VGESERNLRRALQAAERMAPVVLWIDEIEKAFSQSEEGDGGVSTRIFGTFLSWMQDRREPIFVVATANDVSRLPPEFLRKGRFDETFFVDLPDEGTRREILGIHLARRNRDPSGFDLAGLAGAAEGFSGAELEQAVVSAAYTALSSDGDLTSEAIREEIERTHPLSRTMAEEIARLRAWSEGRAVRAH